jgi:hypothetical protein
VVENFNFPNIRQSDFIDESLEKILDRDNASKNSFIRLSSFPLVSEVDIGMRVYRHDLKAEFRLTSLTPSPTWVQITNETGLPITLEMANQNYQPREAKLTSFSATTGNPNTFPFFSSQNNIQLTNLTLLARQLLEFSNTAGMRSHLGLGTIATQNLPLSGTLLADGSVTEAKLSIGALGSLFPTTGDLKLTMAPTASEGWVMLNDNTIGSNLSGADVRGDHVRNLFNMLWNYPNISLLSNTGSSVIKSGNAATDWNSSRRLILPRALGRAIAIAGLGVGLTQRNIGQFIGSETHTLTIDELPQHDHNQPRGIDVTAARTPGSGAWFNPIVVGPEGNMNQGGDQPHNNMQPTFFVNCMIKL